MKVIELHASVTRSNDIDAENLRNELTEKGVLLINLMSSAGSGKTTLLSRIITDLKGQAKIAVLEADIDSAVDAEKIEALGAVSVQVHTDGMCHMDAGMTEEGLNNMDLEGIDIAFLENIGNLICPAEYATGSHINVMLLSVPEGDDKPLKYPLMFQVSDLLLINKIDTKAIFDFDEERCAEYVHKLNPGMKIIPLSAKTGEGFEEWIAWLRSAIEEWRNA
jgi:hydrogenase nickel incorporation protein HypB